MSGIKDGWLIDGDEWWGIDTPVGRMVLAGNDAVLHHLHLPDAVDEAKLDAGRRGRPTAVVKTEGQVDAYFRGDLLDFDLPLEPRGTAFQQQVWWALGEIPYGTTSSYGQLAEKVGNPKACRAVGLANGRNPIPLVLPCHRVIGSNGSLTGYGGGLSLKQRLLSHETEVLARRLV
jgi:methylated-DNA-[protein]-cysteine S-methyltransferase